MQHGLIEILQIQRQKGLPFEVVRSLVMEEGKGIIGDCHSVGGDKQIAMISSKAKNWIAKQELQGLCFARFQGNIVTEGIDYSLLTKGSILKIEQTEIEITECYKRCFPECRRIQDKLFCELKTGIVFAKVIKSGTIQTGNRVRVV